MIFAREENSKMKQLVKKIYNIWKYARLRTWLIVFFCMLSIIPLLTLGICVFRVARGELTIQAQEYFQQNVESTSEILDNDLDYIEEFSLKMNADDRLYEIFQQIDMEDEVELEKASDQIAQILLNYLPWNNSVYSTHLVTSYYRFGEKNKNFYPENSFLTSKMIQKAKEADGKLVWIPTYEYKEMFSVKGLEQVETEYERLFTAVRKLHPSKISSGRIMKLDEKVEEPYLVVNFTEENLKSMLNKYAGGNKEAEYYVVTSEGEIVCSANNKGNFEQIEKEACELTENSGCKQSIFSGEKHIISYSKSQVTGWYVVASIPVKVLSEKIVKKLMGVIVLLIVVVVIMAATLSFVLSKKLNKKIYKPLYMIERVGAGDFNSEVEYEPKDEFAFFYQKLNEMNQNLKNLVHENYEVKIQKRDTEIMALNIQMNPHFLYNSLNIINWICLRGECETASKMLVKLSRMLQYTSKNRELMVELREDLNWLRDYLDIMSYRYEQRFCAEIDIPKEYLKLQVPKLFLQPFVENAIVHAFENYQEDGEIRLDAELDGDDIIFCVEDNGCGIHQEKIQGILSQKTSSIGVRNTNKRLQMLYGETYGVSISSQIGEGTRVFIRIPIKGGFIIDL